MLHAMLKKAKCGNLFASLLIAGLLLSPGVAQSDEPDLENTALLALSINQEQLTAGMMCVGSEPGGLEHAGNPSSCEIFDTPESNMCRISRSSILNPDVLAFDVTLWPRSAITELASRLQVMADPLNYDFSKARIIGRQIRRIEETEDEGITPQPTFEFSFGCYLLMIAPGPTPATGS